MSYSNPYNRMYQYRNANNIIEVLQCIGNNIIDGDGNNVRVGIDPPRQYIEDSLGIKNRNALFDLDSTLFYGYTIRSMNGILDTTVWLGVTDSDVFLPIDSASPNANEFIIIVPKCGIKTPQSVVKASSTLLYFYSYILTKLNFITEKFKAMEVSMHIVANYMFRAFGISFDENAIKEISSDANFYYDDKFFIEDFKYCNTLDYESLNISKVFGTSIRLHSTAIAKKSDDDIKDGDRNGIEDLVSFFTSSGIEYMSTDASSFSENYLNDCIINSDTKGPQSVILDHLLMMSVGLALDIDTCSTRIEDKKLVIDTITEKLKEKGDLYVDAFNTYIDLSIIAASLLSYNECVYFINAYAYLDNLARTPVIQPYFTVVYEPKFKVIDAFVKCMDEIISSYSDEESEFDEKLNAIFGDDFSTVLYTSKWNALKDKLNDNIKIIKSKLNGEENSVEPNA